MERSFAVLFLVAAAACGTVRAHDFWIEPSDLRPRAGSVLTIGLRVGMKLEGDPVPRIADQIASFVAAGPRGTAPVEGEPNRDPAGTIRVDTPGIRVIGYRSLPSRVELDAGKFEAYLADEGLETIVEARARKGESARPGREIYSRCAKSIVDVLGADGERGPTAGFDRGFGFTLELFPEKDPYASAGPVDIPFRLLYEGKPLGGALVVAMSAAAPDRPSKARSDRDGRVSFALGPGFWLVKAVHMIPAAKEAGADWESLWASLTFEIPVQRTAS